MSKNEIEIRQEKSSLASFVERKLPSKEELDHFEEFVEDEKREEEIDDSLQEIYQDSDGNKVDVSSLVIKKGHGFIFWCTVFLLVIGSILGVAYGAYYYIYHSESDATALNISIIGNGNALSGEELEYTVSYKNTTKVPLRDIKIEAIFPDNFIFIDSTPRIDREYGWDIGSIASIGAGNLKIRGKIIGPRKSVNTLLIKISYIPENFSSEFKKESAFTTVIGDIGIDVDRDYFATVLVGDENEINFIFNAQKDNYLENFYFSLELPENIQITKAVIPKTNTKINLAENRNNTWLFDGKLAEKSLADNDQSLKIKYRVNEKLNEKEEIKVRGFVIVDRPGKVEGEIISTEYVFYEDTLSLDVMKSDLNLTLILNGDKNDNTINFGDTLNYSIVYKNKGESIMRNVIVMMVLDSEFLDWTTLSDNNMGREKGNTITWTKSEIPGLAMIGNNEEGIIDFSVKVAPFRESDIGKDFRMTAYAQFNIGRLGDDAEASSTVEKIATSTEDLNKDNRSNAIISKINSDLNLSEQIRYFNNDNVPVGTGPLPPKVGERSSFKVYWTISNNLHELTDARVEMPLPAYVSWDAKDRTSVGAVSFNEAEHKIVWDIGRLPISVFRADAEFSVAVTPTEEDQNKIMVLSSGSTVSATDSETGQTITKTGQARTTKLEDDEIASLSSDGRVE